MRFLSEYYNREQNPAGNGLTGNEFYQEPAMATGFLNYVIEAQTMNKLLQQYRINREDRFLIRLNAAERPNDFANRLDIYDTVRYRLITYKNRADPEEPLQ